MTDDFPLRFTVNFLFLVLIRSYNSDDSLLGRSKAFHWQMSAEAFVRRFSMIVIVDRENYSNRSVIDF